MNHFFSFLLFVGVVISCVPKKIHDEEEIAPHQPKTVPEKVPEKVPNLDKQPTLPNPIRPPSDSSPQVEHQSTLTGNLDIVSQSLAIGSDSICGIRLDKTVKCWGENDSEYVDSKYESVVANGKKFCALRTENSNIVDCWWDSQIQVVKLQDPAVQLFFFKNELCYLNHKGLVFCDDDPNSVDEFKSSKPIMQVSSGSLFFCLTHTDGSVFCKHSLKQVSEVPKVIKNAKSVTVSDTEVCSLWGEHRLSCWGFGPSLTSERDVKKVAMADSSICVVDIHNQLRCFGGLGKTLKDVQRNFVDVADVFGGRETLCVKFLDGTFSCLTKSGKDIKLNKEQCSHRKGFYWSSSKDCRAINNISTYEPTLETDIAEAYRQNNTELIKLLLNKEIVKNMIQFVVGQDSRPLLCQAMIDRRKDIIEILIKEDMINNLSCEYNLEKGVPSSVEGLALYFKEAAVYEIILKNKSYQSHIDFCQLMKDKSYDMIKAVANAQNINKRINIEDKCNDKPLLQYALLDLKDDDLVKLLLTLDPLKPNLVMYGEPRKKDEPIMYHLIKEGKKTLVETALTNGYNPNKELTVGTKIFSYPLDIATQENQSEIVNLLRQHGAKSLPEILGLQDFFNKINSQMSVVDDEVWIRYFKLDPKEINQYISYSLHSFPMQEPIICWALSRRHFNLVRDLLKIKGLILSGRICQDFVYNNKKGILENYFQTFVINKAKEFSADAKLIADLRSRGAEEGEPERIDPPARESEIEDCLLRLENARNLFNKEFTEPIAEIVPNRVNYLTEKSQKDLKKIFRSLTKVFHPDKKPKNEICNKVLGVDCDKFSEYNSCWDVLIK